MLRNIFSTPWRFFLVALVAFFVSLVFVYRLQKSELDQLRPKLAEAERMAEDGVKSEMHHHAKTEKSGIGSKTVPRERSVNSTYPSGDKTTPNLPHVTNIPKNSSYAPARRFTAGPYKGMTYEEAQARKQWKRELDQKREAYSKKSRAYSQALIKSTDEEISLMLSVFKLLSPEQLENTRQEALKTQPAEVVDAFFNDLAIEGITKTPEHLTREAQQILSSREAYDTVKRDLKREREEMEQGYRDFYGAEVYEKRYQERATQIENRLKEENSRLLNIIKG